LYARERHADSFEVYKECAVSDAGAPLARVRLMDGRDLTITPDAARVGDRTHLIARIEEARLLFLQPETIGLRMADVGLVEYTVARPGDGQVTLDAIYHVRPELRRPDLEPPAPEAPPGFQVPAAPTLETATPMPPFAAPGMYPPGVYPPQPAGVYPPGVHPFPVMAPPASAPPAPFPERVTAAYGPRPNQRHATLTPTPRTAGQLISATFRLVARRFGLFALLALLIVFLPNLALGALSVATSALSGQDPFAAAPNPLTQLQQALNGQTPATPTTTATPGDALAGLLSLIILAGTLVLTGWSVAALTVAAREADLGRPASALSCAREGWRRLWPALWALILTEAMLFTIAVLGLGFSLGLILAVVEPQPGTPPLPSSAGLVVSVMAGGLALLTLALLAWLWPRLALAPAAAALGIPAPIRSGWRLASGGAWRILLALLAVGVVTSALSIPAALSQFISNGWSALLIIPIAQMIVAPLSALVRVVALYDQRLRREGYTLFLSEAIQPPATPEAASQDTQEAAAKTE
jgi:hypothetical protein